MHILISNIEMVNDGTDTCDVRIGRASVPYDFK